VYKILPHPKEAKEMEDKFHFFKSLNFTFNNCEEILIEKMKEVIEIKLGIYESLNLNFSLNETFNKDLEIKMNFGLDNYPQTVAKDYRDLFKLQGYVIDAKGKTVNLYFNDYRGAIYSISTLKQLIRKKANKSDYYLGEVFILDYPEIEKRSLSTTFTWYAGYSRVGFDMQLWGFEQWKEFIEICSDYKINQINLCMYGYWPFEFEDFPETVLRDFKMKVWNRESKNWLEIEYTHPNITSAFLSRLIGYAHLLGIDIYAYIGLNSYNGGYSNIHKDKRMKLPPNSKSINDFDALCLSDDSTIDYLRKCVRRIAELGFDGFFFEECEEAFWFCNCDKCKDRFINTTLSPAEAKHKAGYWLLGILGDEIRTVNPNCIIGIAAWMEPPPEKDIKYLKACKDNIPDYVYIYWTPGLYEEEFKKWVNVFGKDRICGIQTFANAIASCNGRLIRFYGNNILRSDNEINLGDIASDIRQHKNSASLKVKGINGYIFEFYGFFLHFFVHANFGWDSRLEPEEFYPYAIESVFGNYLKDDIMYVLKNLFTIHESQINLFTGQFPFIQKKVNKDDVPRIQKAQALWQNIEDKILNIKDKLKNDKKLNIYYKHFEKIENSHRRSKEIYELCLNAIKYDNANTEKEKSKYLKLIDYYNERDFDIVKELFFDIGIINTTGIRSSMFPYHELKRVINNILNPNNLDENQILIGFEALPWLEL
jgi:hypothetical protein